MTSVLTSEDQLNIPTLENKISKIIINILKKEFSGITSKQQIKPQSGRINIACPYCGDSHSDITKKRGNIFLDSLAYHCYNGDCNIHKSMLQFFEDFGMMGEFTLQEIEYLSKIYSTETTKNTKKLNLQNVSMEVVAHVDVSKYAIPLDYFKKKMHLEEIQGSSIQTYVEKRFQVQYHKMAWEPKRKNLYIFNLTPDRKYIIGLQIKTFNNKFPYLTYKLSKIYTDIIRIYPTPEFMTGIHKIDNISNVFGLLELNFNKQITVFEGPLDSLLYTNSVGVCSVNNEFPFDIENVRYFFDNDKAGKKHSKIKLEEGHPVFLWKKLVNDYCLHHVKIKDLNDLVIYSKTIGDPQILNNLENYFSDSKYDLYYL